MSLVFSPVAHCSVEPYAISVDFGREGWEGGGEEREEERGRGEERHWQTSGACFN